MELIFEAHCTAHFSEPHVVGDGPYGLRCVFEVLDGELIGPRVRGKVLPGGADWFLIGSDGFGRLDNRVLFETDDGAIIYTQITGLCEMNDATHRALAGEGTEFADQYYRVSPRLETGAPQYAWVNQTLFVGEGRFIPGSGLEYNLYRVA